MGGGTIITAGLGGIYSAVNNLIAGNRENERAQQNYELNEKAAENADKRTRALYNDLMSPSALLEQYKQAGLSPSLMFGGGGIGGTTPNGAQGEGASGLAPNVYSASPLEMAQTELIQAQTEKTKAETETENELRNPTKQNILQDTATKLTQAGLNDSAKALNKATTRIQKVKALLEEEGYEYNLSAIKYNAEIAEHESAKSLWEAGKAIIDFSIANATQQERIRQIKNETIEQLKHIANIIKDTDLKEAYIKQIESGVAQRWDEITTQKWNAANYAEYVDQEAKHWLRTDENYAQANENTKRGQDMGMYEAVLNAGTAVLQSGLNTAGTVYMADTYKTVGGKPTYTTQRKYNSQGHFLGQTETLTRHK